MKSKQLLLTCLLAIVGSMAGQKAFAYDVEINGIYYNLSGSEATVTYRDGNYHSYSGTIVIPQSFTYFNRTYSVKGIGHHAFEKCDSLTSVNIPNGVRWIGEEAFSKCYLLTSVTIPNSVTSINKKAFYNCYSLTSVNIPDGVTSIGESTFVLCTRLKSVTIGNSVTCIGDYAFDHCSKLTSITIPGSMTTIGSGAFVACGGLTSITIPSSVTSIGDQAFSGCYFAYDAFVNNSTTTSDNNWKATLCDEETGEGLLIKDGVAIKCRFWATSVNIPNSVTSIGEGAFEACGDLTSVPSQAA